ncbi:hypothetical protein [Pseudomonas akapageensis]|uniref:hypothetical protein n=1 Tax=Pseudomonas akapageensis TaxID=2609961 RepID=UPI00140839A8|nr:hypothetical protein [Pseudomonas akapageensis]
MPVRLDQVPALAPRPVPPRAWLWLGLLLLFLLLGVGLTLLFGDEALRQQPVDFWGLALGVPLLGWGLLGLGRALLYIGQQSAADGWDEAREEDLIRRTRRGRRSQQVLSASVYTALRKPGEKPGAQMDALLKGTVVLTAQPSRLGEPGLRHSRLPGDTEGGPELILLGALAQVLADLAPTLTHLPDDTPLALLLEVDSSLPEHQLRRVWRQAWSECGIRQSTTPVEGSGLTALDQWLDQRIDDQALLLVVAVQFAPEQPEGTAEAAVGLLFGNRLTQTILPAIAYLHRPEQARGPSTEAVRYGARQALDWVPLEAPAIQHVWRVGVTAQQDAALNTVLAELSLPAKPKQSFCNLDATLGHPGQASPWLAIAAATQTIQCGVGPQFIFSGGGANEAGLWSTVVTPVPSLSN